MIWRLSGWPLLFQGSKDLQVAFACQVSFEKGYGGIVVFEAKTKLIEHYKLTLEAQMIRSNRMFVDAKPALRLIDKYFNK